MKKKKVTHPHALSLKKVKKRTLENSSPFGYGSKYTTVKLFGESFKKSWRNKKK